jgi:hypothetical protein
MGLSANLVDRATFRSSSTVVEHKEVPQPRQGRRPQRLRLFRGLRGSFELRGEGWLA